MGLTAEDKVKLAALLNERQRRIVQNRIDHFKPYDYQKKFYAAGKLFKHRLLMAANRIGKTFGGGNEASYHATGNYPDWWPGKRRSK